MREIAKKGFSVFLVCLFLVQNIILPAGAKVLVNSIYRYDSESLADDTDITETPPEPDAPEADGEPVPDEISPTMPDIIEPIPENPDDPSGVAQIEPILPDDAVAVPAPDLAPIDMAASYVNSLPHAHDSVDFEAFPEKTYSFTTDGNYYLDKDVVLRKIDGDKVLSFSGKITVNICLNGHAITNANMTTGQIAAFDSTSLISVSGGATVNIYDCYDPATHSECVHTIRDGRDYRVTREVSGGLIGGTEKNGILVSSGVLHMYGGTVAGCCPDDNGAICLKKGTVTLEQDVSVVYNYSNSDKINTGTGGGICMPGTSSRTLIINGATVENNAARKAGGGIYIGIRSNLVINGGRIAGNKVAIQSEDNACGGGGVYAAMSSKMTLVDAVIEDNVSASGVGGVQTNQLCDIRVSGNTVISGNKLLDKAVKDSDILADDLDGAESNLGLTFDPTAGSNPVVTVTDSLSRGASIGISSMIDSDTLTEHSVKVVVADPAYGEALPNEDFQKFTSDNSKRSLLWTDGVAEMSTGKVHYICGASCDHGATHDQAIFNPSSKGFTGGEPRLDNDSYYVESNIVLEKPVIIKDNRTVNICLYGHMISNKNGPVFIVEEGSTLNICDCYVKSEDGSDEEEYKHKYFNPLTGESREVTGGLILGIEYPSATKQAGGIVVEGGSLGLFGGTVAGASRRSGVTVTKGGSFTMWGGSVSDNYNTGKGGGVYVDDTSTFDLRGGKIMNNRSTDSGGGVFAERGFSISGDVNVMGNLTNAHANNVYIPSGTYLKVTGSVTGLVGITLERAKGVFTKGGIAASCLDSFKADTTEGAYIDIDGKELCLAGYGILHQPEPETRAVVMRSPESVKSYQWYETERQDLTDSDVIKGDGTRAEMTYNNGVWEYTFGAPEPDTEIGVSLECFTIKLNKGDTIVYTPLSDITSVSLQMRSTGSGGSEIIVTAAEDTAPAADGNYYVTAPEDGAVTYTLVVMNEAVSDGSNGGATAGDGGQAWQTGSKVEARMTVFRCGDAIAHQTGSGYTGPSGKYVICEIEYVDGGVVVYSEPFAAADHSHLACGSASCEHDPAHQQVDFTPLASNLEGELLAGEKVMDDNTLTDGYYVVVGSVELPGSMIIDGDVTICLMGNDIVSDKDYAIKVNDGATLKLIDCADEYGQIRSNAGGGMYLDDGAAATVYAADIIGSRGATEAGGVYVSPTARFEISSKVRINDNQLEAKSRADEESSNVYLAGGVKIVLFEGTSEYTNIGVTAQNDKGTFTEGAGGDAAKDRFFSDVPGKMIKVLGGELAFAYPEIISQPTSSKPTVTLSDVAGASFQWYLAEAMPVTIRENTSGNRNFDKETGMWSPSGDGTLFTVNMEKWEILRLKPGEGFPKEATVRVMADGLLAPRFLELRDGAYQWTASDSCQVTVSVTSDGDGASLSMMGEIYEAATVQEGKTTDTYSGDAGAYICRVTYPDGTQLQSDLVILEKASKPNKGNSGGGGGLVWNPFDDVRKGDWFYYNVKAAYQAGLMSGINEHIFAPNERTTRGMMVTMLWRMSGSHKAKSKTVFIDVDPNAYYYDAVCWAAENQIVEGMDETHFAPEDFISREQIATLLYRYATIRDGIMIRKWKALDFDDLPADWAMEAMEWAVESQILRGRGENLLDPRAFATRAEIAAILSRYKLEVEEE